VDEGEAEVKREISPPSKIPGKDATTFKRILVDKVVGVKARRSSPKNTRQERVWHALHLIASCLRTSITTLAECHSYKLNGRHNGET
jgi:hypothetical protein